MKPTILLLLLAAIGFSGELPRSGLLLDLDAAKGLTLEDGGRVAAWENQVADAKARLFVKRDEGRKEEGSGRPTLRTDIPELGGKPALVFRRQELVCMDEDTFDGLTTGKGHTWLAVIAVHPQQSGLKDVNSFFGNLRNGQKYEGVWGCFNDDNTLWYGTRNGLTFGRFDKNNPQLLGPVLETGKFHIIGGRMAAGTGNVKIELFAGDVKPVAAGEAPVDPKANPSKMAVGQERDAVEHPGYESFDGEIARFLIWERPLDDVELAEAMGAVQGIYLQK
jgi:hypothetical protein